MNINYPTWKKIYIPKRVQLAIIGNIAASLLDIVSGFSPVSYTELKRKKNPRQVLCLLYILSKMYPTYLYSYQKRLRLFIYLDTIVLKTGKNNTSESAQSTLPYGILIKSAYKPSVQPDISQI